MTKPVLDLDPADAEHRAEIAATLRQIRLDQDMSGEAVARVLGCDRTAVVQQETRRNPNQKLMTVQAHARALHHIAVPTLHGLTVPVTPYLDVLDRLTYSTNAAYADEAGRTLVCGKLAEARRASGLTGAEVAQALGLTDPDAMHAIEDDRYTPMISALQRHARAVGGWLTVVFYPEDAVETSGLAA